MYLMLAFYDSAQALIAENWYGPSTAGGGQNLSSWTRVGGIATAPTNTKYIIVFIRAGAATAADPYFWATKLFLGLTKPGQTQLSPWSASTSSGAFSELNQINTGNVGTYIASAAIGSAQIGNAAINTAHIGDAQITTLKVAGGAITVPQGTNTVAPTVLPIPAASALAYGTETDLGLSYTFPVLDIDAVRILVVSIQIDSTDTAGGNIVIRFKVNGSTYETFYPTIPNALVQRGAGTTQSTLHFSRETHYIIPANATQTFTITAQLQNGQTGYLWETGKLTVTLASVAAFTGKR